MPIKETAAVPMLLHLHLSFACALSLHDRSRIEGRNHKGDGQVGLHLQNSQRVGMRKP